jgi:hypothetical protein
VGGKERKRGKQREKDTVYFGQTPGRNCGAASSGYYNRPDRRKDGQKEGLYEDRVRSVGDEVCRLGRERERERKKGRKGEREKVRKEKRNLSERAVHNGGGTTYWIRTPPCPERGSRKSSKWAQVGGKKGVGSIIQEEGTR